jgi:Kelch motif/Galactose oxidase, central domain
VPAICVLRSRIFTAIVALFALCGAIAAQGCINPSASTSSDPAYADRSISTADPAVAPAAGDVLIAGGVGRLDQSLAAAEFFDPQAGKFQVAGVLSDGRAGSAAALIGNQLLIAGGFSGTAIINNFSLSLSGGVVPTAEIFDPVAGKFSATGAMTTARAGYTATTLPSGKVLIAGGLDNHGNVLDTAEIYDPASGKFTLTVTAMSDRRAFQTATLLPNGKVLVAGGVTDLAGGTSNTADLFDPVSETFTQAGAMDHARAGHSATLFTAGPLSGDVLIAGGGGGSGLFLKDSSAEVYDSSSGQFLLMRSFMNEARALHTATQLPDGRVLLTGGFDGSVAMAAGVLSGASGETSNSAEIFDPAAMEFACIGGFNGATTLCNPSMNFARAGHTATLFKAGNLKGQVLIAGGWGGRSTDLSGQPLSTAEIFDPTSATFRLTSNMNRARALQSATLLQ